MWSERGALGPSRLPQHLKVSGWRTWLPLSTPAAAGWMTLLIICELFFAHCVNHWETDSVSGIISHLQLEIKNCNLK